jgi:hypothetical protein
MRRKKRKILWDGAEVERCRQVRRQIARKYKTFESFSRHLEELEKNDTKKSCSFDELPLLYRKTHARR